MTKHAMDMVLEYAKVFPQNADMGDPESSQKWLRELAKNGGQTVVNAFFTSEDQIQELLDAGFERMALNPNTGQEVDRIKSGNAELGIGKYLQLKRKITDIKEVKDRKTGQFVEVDYGGYPQIVNATNGLDNLSVWDFEEDGPLGNGTEAKVLFDLYNGRTLRLEAISVTKHVPYEEMTGSSVEGAEYFNVGAVA